MSIDDVMLDDLHCARDSWNPEDVDYYNNYMDYVFGDQEPRLKSIKGYPDYEISEYGDVVSYKRDEPVSLKHSKDRHNHEHVTLCNGIKDTKRHYVHRLVAEAFLDNPDNLPIVRHLDDDPSNNCLDNLAWGTTQDNHDDMVRNNHDFRKPVYCIETDTVYRSCAEAGRVLNMRARDISGVCRRENGSVYGYHFCFEEDMEECLSDVKKWTRYLSKNKHVICENLDTGEILEFESRKEAGEYLNIDPKRIVEVIKGRMKHYNRWVFHD